MNTLNWSVTTEQNNQKNDSTLATVFINEIIDDDNSIIIDKNKEKELNNNFVSTIRATSKTSRLKIYKKICSSLGSDDILLPNFTPIADSINSYSALYLKDSINELPPVKFTFHSQEEQIVNGTYFESNCNYYQNQTFTIFSKEIRYSELCFIVPNDDYTIDDINVSNAYSLLLENKKKRQINSHIPYFNIESKDISLSNIADSLIENVKLYSFYASRKLNRPGNCMQSNKFSFSKNGVEESSVTSYVTTTTEEIKETPLKIDVDRPFYAISRYDNLPIFSMKINKIEQ